ncbi:MAG TPA: potassium/proton antiporter [Acidimicrobiaceae bacterium]|nr:potassium/proton antiporter [Acidimicrobiaceae bacterium]
MSGTILVLVASLLLLLGVVASRLSSSLGIPGLLVFLGVGMLAGSDGPGGIYFDNAEVAQTLGVVALAFILFSGGISTNWDEIRPVMKQGIALATMGVLITALLSGVVASWAFDLPLESGLLIGAIISSTDAAAVFSVLRSRSVSLRGNLRPLLELESGSNDPMAVFLTIGFLELVTNPSSEPLDFIPLFVAQMAIGAFAGLGGGRVAVWALNRIRLDHDGLYTVMSLALVGAIFAATTAAQGSGFLAVYIAGIVMAQRRFIHKNSLSRFHDGIAWVAQIGMFVVLGLLVFPSELPTVAWRALLIAAALVLVARPVAVFLTLVPFRVPWRERTLISWVGLRGAAPIILATFPLMEKAPNANLIFDTVFFIVLISVALQGTTIPLAARLLGVSAPLERRAAWPIQPRSLQPPGATLEELVVPAGSAITGTALVELGLPAGTMIVLIEHLGEFTVPTGSTVLAADDRLLILGDRDGIREFRQRMDVVSSN